ncbi:MAG: translocation/assembly module TamB [Elusimicrobiota bacterium]|nr:MAG: translocation/assembly module TamB [Elusimicrobiota bacterium]
MKRAETLKLAAGPLRYDSTKAAKPAAAKDDNNGGGSLLPAWARRTTLGTVDLKLPKVTLVTSSGTTTGGLTAAYTGKGPLKAAAWTVLPSSGTAPGTRYDSEFTLDSDLFQEGKLTRLDLKAGVRGSGMTAALDSVLRPGDEGRLRLEASASVVLEKAKIARAALEKCGADIARDGDGSLESLDLTCGLFLQPARLGIGTGPKPKALDGRLSVNGRSRGRRFETEVRARLGPTPGYGGLAFSLDADLSGSESDGLAHEKKVRITAAIEKFAELVRLLDGTEYAVPAPLNAFDGIVRATATVEGEPARLAFDVRTELASDKQALDVAVRGKASAPSLGKKAALTADVELTKVVLQLPYLELKDAPKPIVDKRIKTGDPARDKAVEDLRAGAAAATPKPAALDYDVAVRTKSPVRILTNLVKVPVPISLDVRAKPAGVSGTVKVESFDTEVFRQNATIDHFTLTPGAAGTATAVDGKIVYKRNDVTVNILVLGSTAKPAVVFESDPPMSQNEIVALVLYGKSPDELDADQKSSAGNATNAMTNGAFGLASLYLFASTPVDSVGYDAATGSYQVKFKLPGGASLSVGSNLQESRTLTLRKRLARHWEIMTEAERGSRENGAITTFLQWFERY